MNGTKDDRLRILKMLEQGKITAEEAEKLLDALIPEGRVGAEESGGKMLRLRVWQGGEQKVNVNIPITLAKLAARFIPDDAKAKMGEKDIDVDELVAHIENGAQGKIVEVDDGEDRVEVTIE
ncbi:hypothetical protein AMJ39_00710 [candidate division TA06 bacterium DG_24]|uniref:YvlB/LiaX N-terminal domain-containing protein n=3 Tax=Bacteria division TA06 TaxID=1156500 RepID=A0A0S8JKU6_UNCT6|nr:MAG: hypothetical protein AMJ39_00710 [candidate division TA06 bacterium DG_24]KPK70883.1 MAG: hypothetical protein AMJ82_01985 [candidate division TA06 bacterium SM23_40]KPL10266.1 MAG: hypothetical protein AMJ71_03730 [candidate division TA06 bacterium SM1_40]